MILKNLIELTDSEASGTGGLGPWIPTDVYADLILDGVVCYGKLSGIITAMEYDFSKGGGDTIQVRYISPRTHSCVSQGCTDETECGCLSATSSSFGTYPVEVQAWGDYDLLCGFSLWEAQGPAMAMIMNEMSKRLANCRDTHIWNTISSYVYYTNVNYVHSSAVSCTNTGVTSCCTYAYDLYNSIVTVMKHMQGDCYEPDYVILHPDVAKVLYFHDGGGYFFSQMPGTTYDGKGQLQTIAGLKVIETGVANSCNTTTAANYVEAVVIDSKRAVGEVWGKRPTFETQRVPECDQTKLVLWQYWGAHWLDPLAIGWVINP